VSGPHLFWLPRVIGRYSTNPARNSLAWAELYLITAMVFSRFDFDFRGTTYEDHVKIAADMYFPHSKRDSGEMRVIVR